MERRLQGSCSKFPVQLNVSAHECTTSPSAKAPLARWACNLPYFPTGVLGARRISEKLHRSVKAQYLLGRGLNLPKLDLNPGNYFLVSVLKSHVSTNLVTVVVAQLCPEQSNEYSVLFRGNSPYPDPLFVCPNKLQAI